MSTEERYEYGYRITAGKGAGREVWEIDHGPDGVWTPYQPDLGIKEVDLYADTDAVAKIRRVLDAAGVDAVILRAKVTTVTDDAEIVG